ncbi:MAG: hypothetical protein HIU81_13250 [Acidobacteria bacterium]|nr:hypothetical protein [Acidobacteriota bacterium]
MDISQYPDDMLYRVGLCILLVTIAAAFVLMAAFIVRGKTSTVKRWHIVTIVTVATIGVVIGSVGAIQKSDHQNHFQDALRAQQGIVLNHSILDQFTSGSTVTISGSHDGQPATFQITTSHDGQHLTISELSVKEVAK